LSLQYLLDPSLSPFEAEDLRLSRRESASRNVPAEARKLEEILASEEASKDEVKENWVHSAEQAIQSLSSGLAHVENRQGKRNQLSLWDSLRKKHVIRKINISKKKESINF